MKFLAFVIFVICTQATNQAFAIQKYVCQRSILIGTDVGFVDVEYTAVGSLVFSFRDDDDLHAPSFVLAQPRENVIAGYSQFLPVNFEGFEIQVNSRLLLPIDDPNALVSATLFFTKLDFTKAFSYECNRSVVQY